ncbi:hypothetical protein [Sporolituus thermophilus]|nr:hypothetical protein [Sporolituus thermophilus]
MDKRQKPISPDKVTDKFSDNAGDNSLTRYEINRSIVSADVANEHSYVKALNQGLKELED